MSVDIWALGCVLYELMALVPPFVGNDMKELAQSIINNEPPDIPREYSFHINNLFK